MREEVAYTSPLSDWAVRLTPFQPDTHLILPSL